MNGHYHNSTTYGLSVVSATLYALPLACLPTVAEIAATWAHFGAGCAGFAALGTLALNAYRGRRK